MSKNIIVDYIRIFLAGGLVLLQCAEFIDVILNSDEYTRVYTSDFLGSLSYSSFNTFIYNRILSAIVLFSYFTLTLIKLRSKRRNKLVNVGIRIFDISIIAYFLIYLTILYNCT